MYKTITTATLFLSLAGAAAADPHDVYGRFLTQAGDSHIEIQDCGDGTPCGKIVWIDPASTPEGQTPDQLTTVSGDKVLGLQILEGFERKKKDWRGGTIYSPEEDKTYASRLKRNEDGSLQLKGCIGPICQTQTWTEAPSTPN